MRNYFCKFTGKALVVVAIASGINFAYALAEKSCPLEDIANPKKSMVQIAAQLKELEKNESCKGLDKVCELRGEGDVAGVWKKHRIFYNHSVIAGSNDMDSLLENVVELQTSGICKN